MEKLEGKWIEVQGYKHDGRMHRIRDSTYVVEETEDYVVVSSKKVKVIEHDFRIWYTKEPAIMVYFKKRWWNVIAMFKKGGITYYVNLASPYIFDKGRIKYIDYDLDIKKYPNNLIRLIDVKEYGYHKKKYQYGDDIDRILRYNINEIKEKMNKKEFPFNDEKIQEYYDKFLKETGKKDKVMEIKLTSKSDEETKRIGEKITKKLFKGSLVTLTGDLGAGKTTITKGIAKGLGIEDEVNSPTFNILKCYFNKNMNLYHIDAYRLEDVNGENKNIGLEEVIEGDGVCVVEWPMFIKEFLLDDYLNIDIHLLNDDTREIKITSHGKKYDQILSEIKELF